jgi:TonB family protein
LSSILRSDCREKESGNVQLSLVVDETGKPRNVFLVHALGKSLDQLALQVVLADRFIPSKHVGVPAAVAMLIDLKLEGCVTAERSSSGEEILREQLKSAPVQTLSPNKDVPAELALFDVEPQPGNNTLSRIGNGISAPVPINTPEATFPLDKSQWRTGVCLINVTVDANGMPQYPKIIRSLGAGMDKQALTAVIRFRFKPAIKAGQPVAVMMIIAVNFRL